MILILEEFSTWFAEYVVLSVTNSQFFDLLQDSFWVDEFRDDLDVERIGKNDDRFCYIEKDGWCVDLFDDRVVGVAASKVIKAWSSLQQKR